MTITFQDSLGEDFIINFVPLYIERYMKEKVKEKLKSSGPFLLMDQYLKEAFGETLEEAVNIISENIVVDDMSGQYRIHTSNNVFDTKSGLYTGALEGLIDKGNLEIQGLHFIEDCMLFIKQHYRELYNMYMMKGSL